jgi:uncharacterized protein (DUF2235 family)
MPQSPLNKRISTWLKARFGRATPEVVPRTRGATTHVIILDGTMSTLAAGRETNAGLSYKLLSKLGGDVSVYYEHGLQWSHWRRAGDVLMGRGINRQIRRAYGYLASRYRPGDRIFLMGFSRGAFAVRSLAGVIDMVGLLRNDQATERRIRDAYRHYKSAPKSEAAQAFKAAYCHDEVGIEMVGVWDTVKSLGITAPILWRLSVAKHAFHSHALGPSIKNGYHALARNETRVAYSPVMWETDPNWTGHMEQMWFRGAHGDVGGMLGGAQESRALSNIPLVWMLEKTAHHGLPLPQNWQDQFPQDPRAPARGTWSGYARVFITRKRRPVGLDPSERVHPSIAQAPKSEPRKWLSWSRQSAN